MSRPYDRKSGTARVTPEPKDQWYVLHVLSNKEDRAVENLTRLLQTGKDVHIRIPLIPAINTTEEALAAIAADLREAGATTVALLPFHRLAAGKYEAMGLDYPYRDTPPLPAEEVSRAAAHLSEFFTVYTEK